MLLGVSWITKNMGEVPQMTIIFSSSLALLKKLFGMGFVSNRSYDENVLHDFWATANLHVGKFSGISLRSSKSAFLMFAPFFQSVSQPASQPAAASQPSSQQATSQYKIFMHIMIPQGFVGKAQQNMQTTSFGERSSFLCRL